MATTKISPAKAAFTVWLRVRSATIRLSRPSSSSSSRSRRILVGNSSAYFELRRLADPRLPAGLRDAHPFFTLLDDKSLLRVCELRCFHATTPRPAKDIYSTKLHFKTIQFLGGRAPVTAPACPDRSRLAAPIQRYALLLGRTSASTSEACRAFHCGVCSVCRLRANFSNDLDTSRVI